MLDRLALLLHWLRALCRLRGNLALENLALRQQLTVLSRRHPRPRLTSVDRFFWVMLRRVWTRWTDALIIVKPDTVVGSHRAGFRLYWRFRSRVKIRVGRPVRVKRSAIGPRAMCRDRARTRGRHCAVFAT